MAKRPGFGLRDLLSANDRDSRSASNGSIALLLEHLVFLPQAEISLPLPQKPLIVSHISQHPLKYIIVGELRHCLRFLNCAAHMADGDLRSAAAWTHVCVSAGSSALSRHTRWCVPQRYHLQTDPFPAGPALGLAWGPIPHPVLRAALGSCLHLLLAACTPACHSPESNVLLRPFHLTFHESTDEH